LSEAAFRSQYGTEEQCRAALFSWRWPRGFVCPKCAGTHSIVLRTRPIQQCSTCRHQVSLIAGTIFHATKLPLITWFAAIYHLTQSKNGLSSLELARRLGVSHYTAWKIQHKLMQVMLERDQDKPLAGERIEVDDADIGGERRRVARMHKIVTKEIQQKQHLSLRVILGRNHAQAKYKGIYRIQALDADSSHLRGLIRLDNIHATRCRMTNFSMPIFRKVA
jgi:hypothetical protein